MKAIILAAGQGTRLAPLTAAKPKALIRAAGRPILQHQIQAYLSAGITEQNIYVVAGYRCGQVVDYLRTEYKGVNVIENDRYAETNNMYSLWLALTRLVNAGEGCLVSNGDCVYTPAMVGKFRADTRENLIACRVGHYDAEAMKIRVDSDVHIVDISKQIDADFLGISMDLFKMGNDAQKIMIQIMDFYFSKHGEKDWLENAFQYLFKKCRFEAFDSGNARWVEIDNASDLQKADVEFSFFNIKQKTCIVLDWDGTLFLGEEAIESAIRFVRTYANRVKFYFMSNNTSLLPEDLAAKLKRYHLSFDVRRFITPLAGLVEFFIDNSIRKSFVLANARVRGHLQAQLPDASFACNDIDRCEAVVVAFDTELTYEKLKTASFLLNNNPSIRYMATHADMVCPSANGPLPDAGTIIATLKATSRREPEIIFGKPNTAMFFGVADEFRHSQTAIVGDRLYTDHVLAMNAGYEFVCVLSGETTRGDVENAEFFPDLVVDDLGLLGEITGTGQ